MNNVFFAEEKKIAVIGTNLSLSCISQWASAWWTKDEINIHNIRDNRYVYCIYHLVEKDYNNIVYSMILVCAQ